MMQFKTIAAAAAIAGYVGLGSLGMGTGEANAASSPVGSGAGWTQDPPGWGPGGPGGPCGPGGPGAPGGPASGPGSPCGPGGPGGPGGPWDNGSGWNEGGPGWGPPPPPPPGPPLPPGPPPPPYYGYNGYTWG